MHRVDTSTALPSLPAPQPQGSPGYFTRGDGGSTPATIPGPDWFNTMQEELIAILVAAGVTPDNTKTDLTQVVQSIQVLIQNAIDGVIDGAPGALDTLNELAAALNDDANAYTSLANMISALDAAKPDYESTVVALGGDFDAGEQIKLVRVGDVVSIRGVPASGIALGHDTLDVASSGVVIPASYRPADDVTNCYTTGLTLTAYVTVTASGRFETEYWNTDQIPNEARSDTRRNPTITYPL